MGMMSRIVQSGPAATRAAVGIGLVALVALIAAPAGAASRHHAPTHHTTEGQAQRPAGTPLMAIVSIRDQKVTIYDADGWILHAPVSTGMRGRETPSGVFAVIQKDRDHHSNLYDDAYMPNMQRITWSGIALHGGPLPGHPASHGCIRMPYGFAGELFPLTNVGMRVIIAPGDPSPVEIASPALPAPKAEDGAKLAALNAAAADAAKQADTARTAAMTATRDVARAAVELRKLEFQKKRADAQAAAAQKALDAATDETKAQRQDAKQQADAKAADLQTQLDAAQADQQKKLDAVAPAREAVTAAASARDAAAKAARDAAHEYDPVSIFISRKTGKLYVRRGFEPLFDTPITIRDPDRPIGTHVFTAMAKTDVGVRWSVVTLTDGHPRLAEADARSHEARDDSSAAADTSAAKDALDRIVIPQDLLDRIAPGIAPRASLIISDEGLSGETGKGTDFVAVLSNEPQGGLSMRHHSSSPAVARGDWGRYMYQRDDRFQGRSPYYGGGYGGGWFGGGRWQW